MRNGNIGPWLDSNSKGIGDFPFGGESASVAPTNGFNWNWWLKCELSAS